MVLCSAKKPALESDIAKMTPREKVAQCGAHPLPRLALDGMDAV